MHFINVRNIQIFENFFELYGESVNSFLTEPESSEIWVFDSNHPTSGFILHSSDYFACNPSLIFKNIAINEANCDETNLIEGERYAMIAHEIGHLFDARIYEQEEWLQKEISADRMAVTIGLSSQLITGLEKINMNIESDYLNEQIRQRIEELRAIL
ncbi:MAG: hypothetical protein V4722_01990 [Bacteroidota bacterium]